ncbi:hypothetical protein [Phormidesmis priestleyi]|uniref:hypothetical protein n=1 Tax=Phormidesmis priestleyi TaxID=268141 RepID=UPI00083B08EC|nr:hypothetical protein [Phormidesmis priestleyi]
MPRPRKNPVTDLPVIEVEPVMGEPGIFQTETEQTKSNVVPISTSSEPVDFGRDWSELDRVLSDVVNFV